MQVPVHNLKAKSAPSTPLTSRKQQNQPLFKSFETERHNISSLHLPPSSQSSTQRLSFFKRDKRATTPIKTDRPSSCSSSPGSPLVSPPGSYLNPDFLFLEPDEQQRLRSASASRTAISTPGIQ